MQKLVRFIFLAALIAVGVWLWRALFPSPERVIQSRLHSLAKTVSFEKGQGTLSQAYAISKLTEFFTVDVEVQIEAEGYGKHTLSGRDELIQLAGFTRTRTSMLKVAFPDIHVQVASDRQSALADVTATVTDGKDDWIQEMNFHFRYVDKKWLIYRVETVKTLTRLAPAAQPGIKFRVISALASQQFKKIQGA